MKGRVIGRNKASKDALEPETAARANEATIAALDRHDEAIVALLREDGRMSSRDLATRIGLNEATVRARMRRLEESGTMRVVAMVDLAAAGYHFVAPVGVQVKGRQSEDVGRDLAAIPQVVSVSAVLGVQDLELQILARSIAELNNLLTEVIPAVPGVARLDSALAMNVVKYESPWVPFT